MSYKTIVVHLDTSPNAHPRLETALSLAKQFGAHLTGVFAVFSPDPRSLYVMAGTAEYYREHAERRAERRAALERLFHAELRRAEVEGEWIAVDESTSFAVPRLGRCADLIVAGQDNPGDAESYVGDLFPENLILSSGRPVLLVPYACSERTTGSRILVAWDAAGKPRAPCMTRCRSCARQKTPRFSPSTACRKAGAHGFPARISPPWSRGMACMSNWSTLKQERAARSARCCSRRWPTEVLTCW